MAGDLGRLGNAVEALSSRQSVIQALQLALAEAVRPGALLWAAETPLKLWAVAARYLLNTLQPDKGKFMGIDPTKGTNA